jgi:hypothetical protein
MSFWRRCISSSRATTTLLNFMAHSTKHVRRRLDGTALLGTDIRTRGCKALGMTLRCQEPAKGTVTHSPKGKQRRAMYKGCKWAGEINRYEERVLKRSKKEGTSAMNRLYPPFVMLGQRTRHASIKQTI